MLFVRLKHLFVCSVVAAVLDIGAAFTGSVT